MKRLFNIASILLALLTTLAFQSCKEEEVPTASVIEFYRDVEKIETINFNVGSAFCMVGIQCDQDWTASCDADWCTISNHAGYGYENKKSYIKVSLEKNKGDQRTANIVVTSGNLTKTLVVNQRGTTADPGDTFESAFEFVENIHMGYNLGNTLDCDPDVAASRDWWRPKSDLDWETVWGQPVTTQEIIDSIAAKGFGVIRVPVTWWPHVDKKTGLIREVWMNRVQQVVDMVIGAGCYCILNVQHDSGARGTRTDGAGWLRADSAEYAESSVKFKDYWTQIATRFKDYDSHLLFEGFNEILDANDTWGDASDKDAYRIVNMLNQDFVDAVRATGGNNEFRNLVCNTYSAGSTEEKLAMYQVPNDVHSNHILASVHSYDPYNFCNDNGEWNVYMWEKECEEEIDAITLRVNSRFNDLGIPYIYGEFGAIDTQKDLGERIKYAKYVMSKFNNYGTTGLWWMGLFDRKKLTWTEDKKDGNATITFPAIEIVESLQNNCK